MNLLHRLPLLWKVLSAPLIAMLCMALYLGSTVLVFKQNNARLAGVRDVEFPVLEMSTENVAALDQIIDTLNGVAASGDAEQLQAADRIATRVKTNYDKLRTIDKERATELARLGGEFNDYYASAQELAALMLKQSGTPDPARLKAMSARLATYRQDLTAFRDAAHKRFAGTIDASVADADRAVLSGLAIGLIGLGLTLAFGVLVARALLGQLNRAVQVAQTVAGGDLTSHIEIASQDETGKLLLALKDMNDSLVRIVSQVRGGAHTIANVSGQIAAGNEDLSGRTEAQASALEETASSMEQLTATVKQNADHAREANTLAMSASEVARKGGAVVAQVVGTMGSINGSAKKIVDIIAVIDGIAFQTNILALNAAVEAARAGEQGRGFAVVATEVRSLAQRSAAAAKQIKNLIGDSVEQVEAGTKLVDEAGATMDAIVASIKHVTDIMEEITSASQEQSAGIGQVNQAIAAMDQGTQQNAALVEEASAAAAALQDEAGGLVQLVSVFKLDAQAGPALAAVPGTSTRPAPPRPAPAPVKLVANAKAPAKAEQWEEF